MCIVSFYIGNNYRDLTAASLCVRLLQTHLLHRSPPRPLEQRSMQPVWWWRLLCFSHRETCSHHIGSFPGHTHGVFCYAGWRIYSRRYTAIGFIMVRLVFATSMMFIQDQHFYLSLVTGLDVTQNISTAESPGRCTQCFSSVLTIRSF